MRRAARRPSTARASCASRFSASSVHIFCRVKSASSAVERALARRVELEHLPVRRDRVLGTAELLVVDLRHRSRRALRGLWRSVACSMRRSMTPMRSSQRSVRVNRLLERGQRLRVRRLDREDLVVSLRGFVDVAEALVDAREPHPVLAREMRVGGAVRELAVEGDELSVRSRALRDSLDLVARLGERGVVAQRRGQHLERVREVVRALGARCAPPCA